MDDDDESSCENNIQVHGIVNFAASPHGVNKNAYEFTLVKDACSDDYRSPIDFNLNPLALGYYTLVVEYFPPEMVNVSVRARARAPPSHPSRAKPRATLSVTQKPSFSCITGAETPPTTFSWICTEGLRAQPRATWLFMGFLAPFSVWTRAFLTRFAPWKMGKGKCKPTWTADERPSSVENQIGGVIWI